LPTIARPSALRLAAVLAGGALLLGACDRPRGHVQVVGSSTVFPFTAAVAENFHRAEPRFPAPVVESTGTGGGLKLFCGGRGARWPDIADASRRIRAGERRACAENGVGRVVELKIGLDGVVLVQGKQGRPLSLGAADVYRALAARPFGRPQTARTWADANPALPPVPIEVIGPPSTSATRDAFNILYLQAGCRTDPAMAALEHTAPGRFASICTRIREDGAFAEGGENDNLVVRKLAHNRNAVGVLGFGFLDANRDRLRGIPIDGVDATSRSIADGSYRAARPLFLYVKAAQVGAVPSLGPFLAEYVSERAIGPDGYLVRRGLVPLASTDRAAQRRAIAALGSTGAA
jgi:phosphate transport system substrate-binding protein